MKKLFVLLVFLFLIYFLIQFSFTYFGKGHEIVYQLHDNDYTIEVKEKFISNYKNEVDNYYFEIAVNDDVFSFQTMHNFYKNSYIIKDIKYYSDESYSCILPVFKNNMIIYDVMCIEGDVITYYRDLEQTSPNLDKFVTELKNIGYKSNQWDDAKEATKEIDTLTLYGKNLIKDHYMAATNYRGLYTISAENENKLTNFTIFVNDTYQRNIEGYINNYYITANYDMVDNINKFYYTDIKKNKQHSIMTYYEISFNSYVQGLVDDSMYLYDLDSDTQYQIDAKNNSVLEVGNKNTKIKHYKNGKWTRLSVEEVRKDKPVFTYSNYENNNYDRADKVGHELSGYYYFYQLDGKKYKAYRSNVQNPEVLTYLFETSSIEDIVYVSDYIYFKDGNDIKYFHDSKGIKTILTNTEYEFNKSLSYSVIVDK